MKANHNPVVVEYHLTAVVVNISISKNESKSQLKAIAVKTGNSCGKYQYFKE